MSSTDVVCRIEIDLLSRWNGGEIHRKRNIFIATSLLYHVIDSTDAEVCTDNSLDAKTPVVRQVLGHARLGSATAVLPTLDLRYILLNFNPSVIRYDTLHSI